LRKVNITAGMTPVGLEPTTSPFGRRALYPSELRGHIVLLTGFIVNPAYMERVKGTAANSLHLLPGPEKKHFYKYDGVGDMAGREETISLRR
jgi:hypothetical protein